MDYFQHICESLKDLFTKAFGDSSDSVAKDVTVQTSGSKNGWQYIASINKASIIRIYNYDAANEVMFHFTDNDTVGARIPAGVIDYIEPIRGSLYMKPSTDGQTVTVNILISALNTH